MADVKENDLPKIASYSDIKEVRLVKTDGTSTGMAIDTFINQIAEKVARVDGFASVVAELINFPFTYLGKISGNVDANNLQTSGYWQLSWGGNTGCSNFPSNNYFYGILIVFNTPNAVYQMAINGDGVHSRLMFDYNWGGWRVL